MNSTSTTYPSLLAEIKLRVQSAQTRAALTVNAELIRLYWEIGRLIVQRQQLEGWGARVIDRLAQDLKAAFPTMRGFSSSNLKYMRFFAEQCPDCSIGQQPADQLPWFHVVTLLTQLDDDATRAWYAAQAITHGWSRTSLQLNIKNRLLQRQGQAVNNFSHRLDQVEAGRAQQALDFLRNRSERASVGGGRTAGTGVYGVVHEDSEERPTPNHVCAVGFARSLLKDPYLFDFLGLGEEAHERDIEEALIQHVTRFLLELGAGFAFVGRQFRLEVAGDEFFIDLLFYHTRLKCYVVVELKATAFKPEHAGQLNFYLATIDAQVKASDDKPTIGLLLCKTQNRVVAEYALSGIDKPIGVAEYQLVRALPEPLDTSLPTIEAIEAELASETDELLGDQ